MKSLKLPAAGVAALAFAVSACGSDADTNANDSSTPDFTSDDTLNTEGEDTETTSSDTTGSSSTGSGTTSSTTSSGSTTSDASDSGSTTSSTCGTGLIDCAGSCIDPQSDESYCGASGSCIDPLDGEACRGDQECLAGACACPAGFVECDGKCINPLLDANYCGATADCLAANAGDACDADETCKDGKCVQECAQGLLLCDGICIDPLGDFNHCGAKSDCAGANAGSQCKVGQVCVEGICQENCPVGQILCDNRCVNPWNDPEFCGAKDKCQGADIGKSCIAPEVCVEGECSLNCRDWQLECDGVCINPSIDPKYCGATDCANGKKGSVCAAGQKCADGKCEEAGCGEKSYEVTLPPSDVMLVLDKSRSMVINSWGTPAVTRWASLHDIVTGLTVDYDGKARFGLKFFPNKAVTSSSTLTQACKVDAGVELAISDASNDAVAGALPPKNGTSTYGATPIREGLFEAVKYMGTTLVSDHPKAIMLLADGQISDGSEGGVANNCYTGKAAGQAQTETVAFATSALDKGIKTYTVGIDLDGTAIDFLDRIAVAGGTEQVIEANNPTQLQAAMESILAKISSCKIPLDPVPERYELLEVKTSGGDAPWLYSYASCAEAVAAGEDRGWVYTKLSGPYDEIELCGITCDEYKEEATVGISLNCPPPP